MSCTLILSRTEATPECTSLRSCSKDFSIWAKRSSACERTECQQEQISISQKIQSPTINLPPNLPGCSFQLANASVSCLLFQASIFQGCLRRQSKFHQKIVTSKFQAPKVIRLIFFPLKGSIWSVYQHPYQLDRQSDSQNHPWGSEFCDKRSCKTPYHQEIPCLQLRDLLAQLGHKPLKKTVFSRCVRCVPWKLPERFLAIFSGPDSLSWSFFSNSLDSMAAWCELPSFLHVSRIQPHRWHNSCWVSDKSTAEPFAFAMAMATFSLTISCKQRDHFQWRFIFETPLHHLSNHFKSGDTAKKVAVLEVLTLVVVRKPKWTSLKNWHRSQCWFYAFFSQV